MKILSLIKGRSFSMNGFSCVANKAVTVEDDERADYLLSTGKFIETSKSDEDNDLPVNEEPEIFMSADEVYNMKSAELAEFASKNDIDISDCKTNKDKADKICGVLGLASTVMLGLEE